jgi:hypothetical protein
LPRFPWTPDSPSLLSASTMARSRYTSPTRDDVGDPSRTARSDRRLIHPACGRRGPLLVVWRRCSWAMKGPRILTIRDSGQGRLAIGRGSSAIQLTHTESNTPTRDPPESSRRRSAGRARSSWECHWYRKQGSGDAWTACDVNVEGVQQREEQGLPCRHGALVAGERSGSACAGQGEHLPGLSQPTLRARLVGQGARGRRLYYNVLPPRRLPCP